MHIVLKINGRTILRAKPVIGDDGEVFLVDDLLIGSKFSASIPVGCLFDSHDMSQVAHNGFADCEIACGISKRLVLRQSNDPADGDDLVLDDGRGDRFGIHSASITDLLSPAQLNYLRASRLSHESPIRGAR